MQASKFCEKFVLLCLENNGSFTIFQWATECVLVGGPIWRNSSHLVRGKSRNIYIILKDDHLDGIKQKSGPRCYARWTNIRNKMGRSKEEQSFHYVMICESTYHTNVIPIFQLRKDGIGSPSAGSGPSTACAAVRICNRAKPTTRLNDRWTGKRPPACCRELDEVCLKCSKWCDLKSEARQSLWPLWNFYSLFKSQNLSLSELETYFARGKFTLGSISL